MTNEQPSQPEEIGLAINYMYGKQKVKETDVQNEKNNANVFLMPSFSIFKERKLLRKRISSKEGGYKK